MVNMMLNSGLLSTWAHKQPINYNSFVRIIYGTNYETLNVLSFRKI